MKFSPVHALLFCLLAIPACQYTSTAPPETVVRQWQSLVDKNQFEEAKKLSTPRTIQVLDMLTEIFSGDFAEAAIIHTEFVELSCQEDGDRAVCVYTIIEEGETFVDSFLLVRENNRWLVDMPEDLIIEPSDMLEELFQEMETDEIQ